MWSHIQQKKQSNKKSKEGGGGGRVEQNLKMEW